MSRSLFSKLVLSGGLLLSTALITPQAMAQKGAVLNPSTVWAVSKIEGQSDGEGYCALARRFNQNTILTFAQNATNELSFALDFQRARFSPNRSIDIVLDAGAGEVREFDVEPVSNKAFVVRLGRDKSFMRALRKTGYLRVEVDGYVYGFNLSDIDQGRRELEDCVDDELEVRDAGLFSGGKPENQVPSVSATNNMELAALDVKIGSLEEENDRIEEARASLERENQSLRMEKQRREIQVTSELDGLKRDIDRMERENERLKADLEEIEAESGLKVEKALSQVRESSNIITDYESRNDDLKSRLLNTEKEYDILLEQLKASEQKNQTYSGDINDLTAEYTKKIEELRKDLDAQREENTKLSNEVLAAEKMGQQSRLAADKEAADMQGLLREYEQKMENLTLKLEQLEKNHTATVTELETQKAENADLEVVLEGTKKTAASTQDLAAATQREYEQKIKELTLKLEQREKNHAATVAELKALEEDKGDLSETHKAKIEALKGQYEEEIAALESALDKQKAKSEDLVAALEGAKKDVTTSQDLAAANEREVRDELEKLRGEYDALTEKLELAEKNASALTKDLDQATASSETFEADTKAILAGYEEKVAELEKALRAKEKAHDALIAEMNAAEDVANDLKNTMDKAEREQSQELAALTKELEQLRRENSELNLALNAQKESEKRNIDLAEAAESEAQKALEKIRNDQETLIKKLEVAEMQNDELIAKLDKVQAENKMLSGEIESTNVAQSEEKEALLAEVKKLRTEKLDLAARLDDQSANKSKELETAMKNNIALEDKIAQIDETYKTRIKTLEQDVQTQTAQNENLKAQLEAKQSDLSSSAQETEKLLASLKEENAALKSKAEAQANENQELKTALGDIKAQYKTLQADIQQTDQMHAAELTEFKEKIVLLERERDALQTALNGNGDSQAAYAKVVEENKILKDQIVSAESRFKAQIQDYEAQVLALKEAESKISSVDTKKVDDAQLNALRADNKMLYENLDSVEQKYAAQIQDLKDQLAVRELQVAELKQMNVAPTKIVEPVDTQKTVEEIAVLKAQNMKLEQALHEAKTARLDTVTQNEARLKNLALQENKMVSDLAKDKAASDQKIKDMEDAQEKAQSRIAFLENQLARANNEKQDALERVTMLKSKMSKAKSDAPKTLPVVAQEVVKSENIPTPIPKKSFFDRMADQVTNASTALVKDVEPKESEELVVSTTDLARPPVKNLNPRREENETTKKIVEAEPLSTLGGTPRGLNLMSGEVLEGNDVAPEQEIVKEVKEGVIKKTPVPLADIKTARSGIYTPAQLAEISEKQSIAHKSDIPLGEETKITVNKGADIPVPVTPPVLNTVKVEKVPVEKTVKPKVVKPAPQYTPSYDVRPLVVQSGSSPSSISIRRVNGESVDQKAVYQWENNDIYGSIEQSPMENSGEFEGRIQAYLEQTEARCGGEFAIMPDDSRQFGAARIDSYDIACVADDVSSTASLLFVKKDKTFSVIAHEAATENMETAMGLRERLISLITRS